MLSSSSIAYLSASLGEKGLFSSANILLIADVVPQVAFYAWLLSRRHSYSHFPWSPLRTPGAMTPYLARAHENKRRNACIFRVSQLKEETNESYLLL